MTGLRLTGLLGVAVVALIGFSLAGPAPAEEKSKPVDEGLLINKLIKRIDELEKRVAELEQQRPKIHFAAPAAAIAPDPATQYQLLESPPNPTDVLRQRGKRGVINGLEYYVLPLGDQALPAPTQ